MAHYLLTLLLPFLQSAVKIGVTPRIINLASIGHNFQFKHFTPEQNKLDKFLIVYLLGLDMVLPNHHKFSLLKNWLIIILIFYQYQFIQGLF